MTIGMKRYSLLGPACLWAAVSMPVLGQVQAEGGGQALAALVHLQSKSTAAPPRTADGKPELSGIWGPDVHFMYDISSALKPGETLPLRPEALKAPGSACRRTIRMPIACRVECRA